MKHSLNEAHFGNQLEAGDRLIMRMHVNVRRMLPEQSGLAALTVGDGVRLTGFTSEHVKLMTNRFCFRCFKPDFVSEIEFPTREAVREIVREKLASVSQVLEEAVKSHLPKIITGSCTLYS